MSTIATGAESVEWNLSDLYEGPDDPRIESELEEAHAAAQAFRERYRGKLGELSAAELNDAVAGAGADQVDRRRASRRTRGSGRPPTAPTRRAARSSRRCASGTRRSRPSSSSSTSSGARSTTTSPSGCSPTPRSSTTPPSCARSAATSRTSSPSPRRRSRPRRASPASSAWGRLFNELLSDLSVSLDGDDLSLDEALARLSRETDAGRARARRRGGHRGAPARAAHARLRPQHDPERARDRGPPARLRLLDLGAEPRERDPGRGGAEPRRRDRGALRHPAALLRAQGAAARPAAAARLRPLRAAPGGRRHDRLGRRARDRARRRSPTSRPQPGDIIGRLLRAGLDRRGAAAGEDARRLLRDDRSRTSTRTC